ncbi:MAG: hypothetical protein QM674_15745 [Burkholderiaceae bacterium]
MIAGRAPPSVRSFSRRRGERLTSVRRPALIEAFRTNMGYPDGERIVMKQGSMSTKSWLWSAAFTLAAWSAAAGAQNLPVPGECGDLGNRACPIGAPAAPIGEPVGAVGITAPGAAPAYGGQAYEPPGATGQTPPPDNGFSWQQRTPDGTRQTCRRGLDGITVRCDTEIPAVQPAAR